MQQRRSGLICIFMYSSNECVERVEVGLWPDVATNEESEFKRRNLEQSARPRAACRQCLHQTSNRWQITCQAANCRTQASTAVPARLAPELLVIEVCIKVMEQPWFACLGLIFEEGVPAHRHDLQGRHRLQGAVAVAAQEHHGMQHAGSLLAVSRSMA